MSDLKLREQLSRDEGRKLKAYKDTNGFWTIGVGHLLGATPRMTVITDAECDALLDWDIAAAKVALHVVFGDIVVDEVRMRAMTNMAFNRGARHMRESTTITPAIRNALINAEWGIVAAAIKASPWAKQIGARADRLAHMFETGEDA